MTGISAAVIALGSTEEVRGNSCGGLSLEGIAGRWCPRKEEKRIFGRSCPRKENSAGLSSQDSEEIAI